MNKEHLTRAELERLYINYAPRLIFYARKFVDYSTAEDVVHDVFLKIRNSDMVLPNHENIGSYLFSSVRNTCLDLLKHRTICDDYLSKTIRDLKIDELTSGNNPEKMLIDREQIESLYKEINRLPQKCREVFLLAYIEEKKNAEIASQLQISVRTVEAQIYKALKILRNTLIIMGFLFLRVFA
jgi:RNA polymerase sigma-70 factor (ECF subfamily)